MVYSPNKAINPGYTLARILDNEGMTQKSLGERTSLGEKHISRIINGKASITVKTALLLENALGGSASFWINLEKNYQETKERLKKFSLIKKEIPILSEFPYKELAKANCVPETRNKNEMVENLWKWFGVSSLFNVRITEPIAYRKRTGLKVKSGYISAWLRWGELEAKNVDIPEYSEPKLMEIIPTIKLFSTQDPTYYSQKIVDVLKEAGVCLVYVPHFPGTGVNGAVRWINKNPVIQLSIFDSWADIFWFSLYHEIGHLILHSKKDKFIEFDNKELSTLQKQELEADKFASTSLISDKDYSELLKTALTTQAIIKFSKTMGINPGIVEGRLCHDNKIKWNQASALRSRLQITKREAINN